VKIVRTVSLQSKGRYAASKNWRAVRGALHDAIRRVSWPPGSGKFTIYPESGKKRGKGNGVKPIKAELMAELAQSGWKLEARLDLATSRRSGKLDAVLQSDFGPVAVEWETGNISSSHRALNKMALGILKGSLVCGVLIVPSRVLYKYLTDRVGNIDELEPYFDLWRAIPCSEGVLEIVVVEQDAESVDVPKIGKGTDGRALG
jgi:hypothetical protein